MSEIELPSGWHRLSRQAAEQFEVELQRELCPGHVLYGVSVQALARLERRDEFLFRIPDSCFAQVHLTWAYEINPLWPSTEVFSSIEEWRAFLIEDELDYHAH